MKNLWIALCVLCIGCDAGWRRLPDSAHDYSNQGKNKSFDVGISRVFADDTGMIGWMFSSGHSSGFLLAYGCPDGYDASDGALLTYKWNGVAWEPEKLTMTKGGAECFVKRVYFSDDH